MIAILWIAAGLGGVIAAFLISARGDGAASRRLLGAAFGGLAAQMALAALQLGSGPGPQPWLRPLLAMLLGPLFFLHLDVTRREPATLRRSDLIHLAPPMLLAFGWLAGSGGPWIDAAIFASFVGYAALVAARRRGLDPALKVWRRFILAFLVAAAACDLIIVLELHHLSSLSGSVAFAASILLITGFCAWTLLASLHRIAPMAWLTARKGRPPDIPAGLVEDLEAWMRDKQAYLDPDLTVARLARRIGHPARAVSNAVNAIEPKGFSRWLNGYRIRHAQRIMTDDPRQGVLDVLLSSGFQSKSTFNAAFKAVTGLTPTQWRDRQILGI